MIMPFEYTAVLTRPVQRATLFSLITATRNCHPVSVRPFVRLVQDCNEKGNWARSHTVPAEHVHADLQAAGLPAWAAGGPAGTS